MPKSKRNRLVSLTVVKKKKHHKVRLVENIRNCVDSYDRIFLFRISNMRNDKMNEARVGLRQSRFFFGKNKVMRIGFGRTKSDEYKKNLSKFSQFLFGQCGILFTNQTEDEILKFFDEFRPSEFARTGDVATETVDLCEGPLEQFTHNMEPYLRLLGLPTALNQGVVNLVKDFQVCREGEPLTSEQAQILKLLGIQMAEFRFRPICMWENRKGKFKIFYRNEPNDKNENDDDDDNNGNNEEEEEEMEDDDDE